MAKSATFAAPSSGCHSGASCAQLGKTTPTNGDLSISQTSTVPTGKSQLSIWYKMTCPNTVTYDWATITFAGSSYMLTLTSHDDDYSADPSYTLYDDVTLS
jgi:hypothetical protein